MPAIDGAKRLARSGSTRTLLYLAHVSTETDRSGGGNVFTNTDLFSETSRYVNSGARNLQGYNYCMTNTSIPSGGVFDTKTPSRPPQLQPTTYATTPIRRPSTVFCDVASINETRHQHKFGDPLPLTTPIPPARREPRKPTLSTLLAPGPRRASPPSTLTQR